MLFKVLKISGLLAIVATGGEFLTPPLSCWLAKGVLPGEAASTGGAGTLLVQPSLGVVGVLRRLAEPPPNLPGATCRAALLRQVGIR
jgi:hypothetical protein